MALEDYGFDSSLQVASMDAISYDQIFITRPMADDIWYGSNNCCNMISDYRAVEEANELLNAASLPVLDTDFTMFNGAEVPAFHGIYSAPHAADVHGDGSTFFENYGDYRSDIDGGGNNCAKLGGVSGGVEGRDVVYDEAVLSQEHIGPLCVQNELQLICGNVNDDFSTRYSVHQNILKNTTGESCYDRGCFNPYENKTPTLPSTENVVSTLLSDEKRALEPLEYHRPGSMNNDNKQDLASEKTDVHREGQQFPQDCRNGFMINNNITENQGIMTNQEDYNPLTQKTVVSLVKSLSNSEGRASYVQAVAGGGKKGKGQPAKNLLAERRRRKRLNDRLCMLRSVVPTISKMDRTSILSDTIEYTKQLLNQIKCLHKEVEPQTEWPAHLRAYGGYFGSASDRYFADKTIPKLEVRRTEGWHLNIHMASQTNPNLLMSTVSTLESFGLEIQEGIFTCFSDFGMQVQCSETEKGKRNTRPEEIKVALLQKAGCFGKSE